VVVRAPAPPRAVVPVLAAAAGVVVAHAAGYVMAFPSAAERGPHLEATGHGYWPLAVAAAVACAGVALLVCVGSGALRGRAGGPTPTWRAVRALAGWQVAAFVMMELAERTVAGARPEGLLTTPEFWLGLLLQLPVALVATRLLRTAERTGFRMASALRRRPRPVARPAVDRPRRAGAALPAAVAFRARPRAPPLVLATV
jgi:hypothetical protein